MEITEALRAAKQAIEQADLPETWQERAYGEVLHALLGGGEPAASSAVATLPREVGAGSGSGLQKLAARFGVHEEALADVFAIEDDAVTVHVASGKLSATKSRATREVALLIAGARQGIGIDEAWTDITHVRNTLTQYNRYDRGNFAKYLRETQDVFNFKGKPVSHIRLTRQGWEAATELIKNLTGSAQ
jgi:hypothetical protein